MKEMIQQEIDQALEMLNNGGIILYPTDTIWGLGCDATNRNAIEKIFAIKHRSPFKSMIILVDTSEMIGHYVKHPSTVLIDAMTSATTPTTAVFNGAKNLPSNLVNEDGSIAIRIASDHFCRDMIRQFGKPIVSTSANISDQPSPANFFEIDPALIGQVNYAVHFRRDDDAKRVASAIIRLNEQQQIEKLR